MKCARSIESLQDRAYARISAASIIGLKYSSSAPNHCRVQPRKRVSQKLTGDKQCSSLTYTAISTPELSDHGQARTEPEFTSNRDRLPVVRLCKSHPSNAITLYELDGWGEILSSMSSELLSVRYHADSCRGSPESKPEDSVCGPLEFLSPDRPEQSSTDERSVEFTWL